jgi:hypothetical protein
MEKLFTLVQIITNNYLLYQFNLKAHQVLKLLYPVMDVITIYFF